jgi:hypothetical protein
MRGGVRAETPTALATEEEQLRILTELLLDERTSALSRANVQWPGKERPWRRKRIRVPDL